MEETPTLGEFDQALSMWINSEQYQMERRKDFNKLKSSLNLFVGKNSFLRLKGRFGHSCLEYGLKYPILLRGGESFFTQLVVRDAHNRVLHHGVETTLSYIRSKYWIIKGRKTVKDTLRKCIICKRFQGKVMCPPATPDLPNYRVDGCYSFHTVGLDYAGPLYIKNKDALSKVYVLLFTCATSRAVHVELTPDMYKSSFIRAFQRFVARKGKPSMVVHDNAKTFKSRDVKRFMVQHDIKQRFILPASPWWGGFYERLVRSVKLSLRKTLGRSLLTYEELETVLCNIESVINNRPLTYVSEDDMDEPLTPYHLMFGRNAIQTPVTHENHDVNLCNVKRVRYLNTLLESYWKKFTSLYLNELRQKHIYIQRKASTKNILVKNDVVLIKDDSYLPRYRWRLGKVEDLITGRDGNVRGAKLKVVSNTGEVTTCYRPVQKLIPFEIAENLEKNDTTNDNEAIVSSMRPQRRAAVQGQILRQLREKYN